MLIKKRFTLLAFILLVMMLLGACAIGQAPQPTPEALDVDAIYTSAAETAVVQMTEIASLATPTLPPTATLAPTEATEESTSFEQVTPLADDTTPAALPDNPLAMATQTPLVSLPGVPAPVVVGTPEPECNDVFFEAETMPDGTKVKAGTVFTKVWKFRNTGTCTWTDGYSFRFIDGHRMSGTDYYFVGKANHIAPGQAISMGITMRAPNQPGRYRGYWQLYSDQATNHMAFGWAVWLEIEVTK